MGVILCAAVFIAAIVLSLANSDKNGKEQTPNSTDDASSGSFKICELDDECRNSQIYSNMAQNNHRAIGSDSDPFA